MRPFISQIRVFWNHSLKTHFQLSVMRWERSVLSEVLTVLQGGSVSHITNKKQRRHVCKGAGVSLIISKPCWGLFKASSPSGAGDGWLSLMICTRNTGTLCFLLLKKVPWGFPMSSSSLLFPKEWARTPVEGGDHSTHLVILVNSRTFQSWKDILPFFPPLVTSPAASKIPNIIGKTSKLSTCAAVSRQESWLT